jgi:thiol-disulfide isomerase/thioredoxin
MDSAVVQDSKFQMKGQIDYPFYAVLTGKDRNVLMGFFVENANISMSIDPTGPMADEYQVSGSKLNELYGSYTRGLKPVIQKFKEFNQYAQSKVAGGLTEELNAELTQKQEELKGEFMKYSTSFVEKNPGTILTATVLLDLISSGEPDAETVTKHYEKLHDKVKQSETGKSIADALERLKTPPLAEGQQFRDLTMTTPDDKQVSISDYAGKGKYVLLDFWASWCAPCRMENPNVVKLYKKYKNKGFEIVGISLDEKKDAWAKGISDDGITWVQMSDLKGWNSQAALKYKIQGIPFTVLLDGEGKIIGMNLRGGKLEEKLAELFKDANK